MTLALAHFLALLLLALAAALTVSALPAHFATSSEAFVCPLVAVAEVAAVGSSSVVQYPARTSCSMFYKCNHGVATAVQCPDGLHYNANEEVCDFPAHAKCHLGDKI